MSRNIYHVVPDSGNWQVKHNGQVLSSHYYKESAIESGRRIAKANMPSQLVVHKADGTIEYEYTYGSDPYPPKG